MTLKELQEAVNDLIELGHGELNVLGTVNRTSGMHEEPIQVISIDDGRAIIQDFKNNNCDLQDCFYSVEKDATLISGVRRYVELIFLYE